MLCAYLPFMLVEIVFFRILSNPIHKLVLRQAGASSRSPNSIVRKLQLEWDLNPRLWIGAPTLFQLSHSNSISAISGGFLE